MRYLQFESTLAGMKRDGRIREAERHVANAEALVTAQATVVQELTTNRQGTAEAQRVLQSLEKTLAIFKAHHSLVVAMYETRINSRPLPM